MAKKHCGKDGYIWARDKAGRAIWRCSVCEAFI